MIMNETEKNNKKIKLSSTFLSFVLIWENKIKKRFSPQQDGVNSLSVVL